MCSCPTFKLIKTIYWWVFPRQWPSDTCWGFHLSLSNLKKIILVFRYSLPPPCFAAGRASSPLCEHTQNLKINQSISFEQTVRSVEQVEHMSSTATGSGLWRFSVRFWSGTNREWVSVQQVELFILCTFSQTWLREEATTDSSSVRNNQFNQISQIGGADQ